MSQFAKTSEKGAAACRRALVVAAAICAASSPSLAAANTLRLLSYNVRHCSGSEDLIHYSRTAAAIQREMPDFVGLQEVDVGTTRSKGIDQGAELSRLTGMHVTFAKAIDYKGGQYGVAVLSKEKPLSAIRKPLPGPEPRVLLLCEFANCWFGTTHLDSGVCKGDAEPAHVLSVPTISNAVARCASGGKPVFLTGDWNATPTSRLVEKMECFLTILNDKKVPTNSSERRTIDYVTVDRRHAGRVTVKEAHVTPDRTTSDHKPVFVSVAVAAQDVRQASAAAARDLFADTWDAMDDLGRCVASAGLPAPRAKKVGIFYWTWHQGRKGPVLDNSKLLAEDPTLPQRPQDPKWGLRKTHYWGEPAFGYYATTDAWVLRRHAQLLSAAGVDAVVFDATNGTLTWMDSLRTLMRTWGDMRAKGERTPQFAYMLPFWPGKNQAVSILQLYRDVYRPGVHRELWFMWQGKPLIHATPDLVRSMANDPNVPENDRRDYAEIAAFFTFRPLQPAYAVGPTRPDHWCWLEAYPQHEYGTRADGTVEMCAAGVAQNHSWRKLDGGRGLAAMNDTNVFGRAYMGPDAKNLRPGETLRFAPDRNPRRGEPNRFLWGDNFAQQLERARTVDPDYLFVTGWNEFIAGNFDVWQGKQGAFPDQYSPEFSRDIEPSNGILQDHFYCQFVDGVRRFKGVRPQRSAAQGPVFRDAAGDVDHRDAQGFGAMRYVDKTGRNDIVECFVSHDAESVTFKAVCASPITPRTDPAWMRLFISLRLAADDPSPHWHHLHFVVNRVAPPTDGTAVLERCRGGWSWQEAARVKMKIDGNALSLTIPRAAIGQMDRVDVRFKWADNTPGDTGDILDFYRHGDAAPDGRFLYHYFE